MLQVAITSTGNGDPVLPGGLYINDTDIAWSTDTGKRIGHYLPQNLNTDPALRGGSTVTGYLNDDQHFAVWMRIAQLSNFRKLYGRIDSGVDSSQVCAGMHLLMMVQQARVCIAALIFR